MLSKKVKSRILFLSTSSFLAILIIFIVLKSLEKNVVYFFSPTEIFNDKEIDLEKKIRVGGLVKKNSLEKNENSFKFIVTDQKNEIIVSYTGLLPNLFSEGKLKDRKYFIADTILAKHDENYMPPEVKKALDD